MRPKYALFIIFIAFFGETFAQNRFWVATTASNWNNTANWSTLPGGPGGASVPGPGDAAIFDGGGGSNGICNLDMAPTVNGIFITGYTGTVDLSGFDLTTTGINTLTTGTLLNSEASASLVFNTTAATTFSGTSIQVPVTGTTGRIFFNGSTFDNTVTLTKTDNNIDDGTGNNTFNGVLTLTITSTGMIRMGATNPDIFDQNVNLITNGSGGDIVLALSSAGNEFHENIAVDYQTTGEAAIGSGGGTATLADGKIITVNCGASGCGDLTMSNLTQLGSTAQTFTLTGNNNATVTIGPNTIFNAPLSVTSPSIILNSSTFNNTVTLTRTGSNVNDQRGGNAFFGVTTITNQGGGDMIFGSTGGDAGDVWHANVTFNNTAANRLRIGEETSGNIFHANATFNCSGAFDNSQIQISVLNGAETTFNGTTTFLNSGTSSDIHISHDAGSSTTFNGAVIYTSSATGGENYIGVDGNVAFAGDLEVNSTSSESIFLSQNNGSITFGNGTITTGATGFATGILRMRRFTQTGTTAQALTLTGTSTLRLGPSVTFNGNVDFIAPQLLLDGVTFNGTAGVEKSGATDNAGAGGNIFNGTASIINSGSASFEFGSTTADTFEDDVTITNTGTSRIQIGTNSAGNIFNGNVTINHGGANGNSTNTVIATNAGSSAAINGNLILNCTNSSTSSGIIIGSDGNVTINGNITAASTNGRGILFGLLGGVVTLANGYTISDNGAGTFTTGTLTLKNFTQQGGTAQNITLTGTANLVLGSSSVFNGAVTFVTPQLNLNGCTFQGTTYLEKTGASDNLGSGSNTFNGVTTIVNSGSGYFTSGNTTSDAFNNDLTLSNTGSSYISMAENSAGNVFGGNIVLNSTAGSGIYFGNNTSGSATLATGKTISVGISGFTSGELRLLRFTQAGSTAQSVTLTGSAVLRIGPSTTFDGNVSLTAPGILLQGGTFNGTAEIEKTGSSSDSGAGNNVFFGATTLENSGSGNFISANTTVDTFHDQLTLSNTGAGTIFMAHNVAGTVFEGNIILNSTAGGGIYFCNNNGTASLASGRTITVGPLGFSIGELRLQRFTQLGSTNQSLTLTGTSILRLGPSSTFNGNVTFISPQVLLHGATYAGTAYIQKNGAGNDAGTGGNVFQGTTTLFNSGSGSLMTGASSADTFNGELTLTNTGSNTIFMAHNCAGTAFNGNVIVNSTNGAGIAFSNSAGGSSVLAAGNTLTVGGTGFTTGQLILRRFTQNGATAQNISLGGGTLRIGPSVTFNGDVTLVAPAMQLEGATFAAAANITKSGTTNDDNAGGNTFNGTTTITNNGTGRWRLATTSADNFTGNVTFVRNTGTLEPAYAQTNTFSGDITVNSSSTVTFGSNGGTVQLTGTNAQSVNKTGAASPIIQQIIINKASGAVTLNSDVTIGTSATFTSGIVNTTSANYLNIADNATVTGVSNSSYVDGPVRKTGDDAFTFPVGDGGYHRPIAISAPGNTTHHFTAQYFKAVQAYGGSATWDPSFYTISGCEYWTLDRTNGTSDVNVTLSWNESACGGAGDYVTNPPDLRVTRWNGTSWVDHGNGGTTGTTTNGTIVTSAAVTSFSPFTLASTTPLNPLPVELKRFWASNVGATVTLNWITASEKNNHYFTLQRSSNGIDFLDLKKINSLGESITEQKYSFVDESPLNGRSYYRLKQTDFDGKWKVSGVISVQRENSGTSFTLFPNPAGNEIVFFNERTNVMIYNNVGQIVSQFNAVNSFDATGLPAGVYVIKSYKGEFVRLIKK